MLKYNTVPYRTVGYRDSIATVSRHLTVVHRIKIIRTNPVYVFWKKVDGLLRIDVEMIQKIAGKLLTPTQAVRKDAKTPNQKEKLGGRVIRTTVVSRTVGEIPFGIDKTNGSHAQLTR